MRSLAVTNAEYIDKYLLRLSFSDGTLQAVDFGPFLLNHPHPQLDKYRQLANFKRFRIERGNVVWDEIGICFCSYPITSGIRGTSGLLTLELQNGDLQAC